MSESFVVQGSRVLIDPKLPPMEASFLVEDGVFKRVEPGVKDFGATKIIQAGNAVVLPGFVDTHAHINEPGRTDWEGFKTATQAAAAGGITTVVDMPLNSIPATTSMEALAVKRASAKNNCFIDYMFWGGVIPGNTNQLEPMAREGIAGFKCFLCPSGVDEFPHVVRSDLEQAMPVLARLGVPLIVHAEIEGELPPSPSSEPENHYAHYLHSRPPEWECRAIELVIELSKKTGCAVHIVHLSAADALPMIKKARADGVKITVETCPHYLHLHAEAIQEGATHFKCAPPIRDEKNREGLWEGIRSGLIDFVVSDHSPCVPKLKCMDTGNFMKAWGGIAGLQMSPSVVWTEMSRREMTLNDLHRLMSLKTAELVGLSHRKAQIKAGFDADFIFFDENKAVEVSAENIFHKHKISPYTGEALRGSVQRTFVRGQCVYDHGSFLSKPSGQELVRKSF